VRGAGTAIKAALAAAGVSAGAAAATVAAVAGAALLGWFIGNGINDVMDRNSPAQLKANAAVRLNHARRALAEALGVYDPSKPGVGLTRAQWEPLNQAYQESLQAIDRAGRDSAYAARVKSALGTNKDWRTIP